MVCTAPYHKLTMREAGVDSHACGTFNNTSTIHLPVPPLSLVLHGMVWCVLLPAGICSPALCLRQPACLFLNGPAAVDCTAACIGDWQAQQSSLCGLAAPSGGALQRQPDLDMVSMDRAMSGDRRDSGGAGAAETPGVVPMFPGQSRDSVSHPSPHRSELELQNTEQPGSPVWEEPSTMTATPVPPRGRVECPRPQTSTHL
ncbi:hypothetical protein NDU88_002746 [Pleurodeles waltl]|uniref:Uncharacterized protein n=1 Tax=Pleurodeles waltl TaxID=8319 RepID=A0AAV7WM22_PLEWA|nr:hypothetical protein NDU88_002746 [Pleurodeles waltl]